MEQHTVRPRRRQARPGRRWLAVLIVAIGWLGGLVLPQAGQAAPQFGLPFAGPPGPSTWYVAQWYGDTEWAYRNWPDLYSEGQGLHFGIDFAAPCGTPIQAIGDGVVFAVDGPYGAPPHNLVIDHGNGYLSLYGHLLQRAPVQVGQHVTRGQVVAYSGAPSGSGCDVASHLHLEIRRTGMGVAVDPIPLIAANWRAVGIGADTPGTRFELDYANPSRWQVPQEQPDVTFGGPILDQFSPAWPPQ